jgi:hypothetical protein
MGCANATCYGSTRAALPSANLQQRTRRRRRHGDCCYIEVDNDKRDLTPGLMRAEVIGREKMPHPTE